MKLITAIGNPVLNEKLRILESVCVVGRDIQYQEGIVEILEECEDIDCLIIHGNLPGEIGFYKLINKIKNIKPEIDICVFLEKKDENIENYLSSKEIYKIYYLNQINFDDFVKIFKNNKNNLVFGINKEINEFKKLILNENLIEDNYTFVESVINENFEENKCNEYIENFNETNIKFGEKQNENVLEKQDEYCFNNDEICKTIAISGNFGSGKSLVSVLLSNVISKQNKKCLLIDFDLENSSINTLLGIKKYKEKQSYVEDCITKVDENLDVLCGIDKIINFREIINNYAIKEIIERLKIDYDFIIMDVSSRIDFKYVKIVLTYCEKIVFLIEPNLLEISKSNKFLEVLISDFNIDVDKIKIIFNKSNKYKIIENVLEEIFSEIEIIGCIEYEDLYSLFINKNTQINFDENKFERIYQKLIKKEEGIYANASVRY
ncbi:MAG: AAA family ATPase [Clostridia bacterium]|nr:AAA family ATPase [Clostridia bacterium]